jgi:hypothetical protein
LEAAHFKGVRCLRGLNSGGGRVNCAAGSFIPNSFAQFAESMTATLADLHELARPDSRICSISASLRPPFTD